MKQAGGRYSFGLYSCIFAVFWAFGASTSSSASSSWTRLNDAFFYSESSIHSHARIAVNESKLQFTPFRYDPLLLEAYAGANLSQALSLSDGTASSGNHVALYPGLRLRVPLLPIVLHAEYWQLFLTHPGSHPGASGTANDLRLGAYGYTWRDLALISPRSRLFSETYGDLLFSDRLNRDVFLQAWSKAGVRISAGAGFNVDPFVEGVLKRSRNGLAPDNLQDLRTGARVTRQFGPVGAFLIGSYGLTRQEWTGLLALSGGF